MPLVYFSLAWAKLNVFWLIIWKFPCMAVLPLTSRTSGTTAWWPRPPLSQSSMLGPWQASWSGLIMPPPLKSPPRWGWMWCPPSHMPGGNGSTFCWRPRWGCAQVCQLIWLHDQPGGGWTLQHPGQYLSLLSNVEWGHLLASHWSQEEEHFPPSLGPSLLLKLIGRGQLEDGGGGYPLTCRSTAKSVVTIPATWSLTSRAGSITGEDWSPQPV